MWTKRSSGLVELEDLELELEQSGLLWTGSEVSFGLDPMPLGLLELQLLTIGINYTRFRMLSCLFRKSVVLA